MVGLRVLFCVIMHVIIKRCLQTTLDLKEKTGHEYVFEVHEKNSPSQNPNLCVN